MGDPADEPQARWLASARGRAVLEDAAPLAGDPLRLIAWARERCGADLAPLVATQVELRSRAVAKFPLADRLLLTGVGLQQATDAWTARYKSARFVGASRVADVCCGIGGDLMAIGGRVATLGVDASDVIATLARANAETAGVPACEVVCRDAADPEARAAIARCDAWHIDPDRRRAGRRSTHPSGFSPGVEAIEQVYRQNPNGAIKLAPASPTPPCWAADRELQWLSRGGECRQLIIWSGRLAEHPGERRATSLDAAGRVRGDLVGTPSPPPPIARELGPAIYEPDPALFAAGLDSLAAAAEGLERVTPAAGYLTGPVGSGGPLLAEFRLRLVMPLRHKLIARALADHGIGRLEIKCRGVEVDPAVLRSHLRPRGPGAATLLITRRGRRAIAILAQRAPDAPAHSA